MRDAVGRVVQARQNLSANNANHSSSDGVAILDDFEALLEVAERITKSSAQPGLPPEVRASGNREAAQLATALQAK